MRRTLLLLAVLQSAQPAWAGVLDDESLRLGGGFGSARVDGVVEGAIDAFAGIDVWREGPWRFGAEATALDVSNSDADGLGVSGIMNWGAAPDVEFFARAGADFGGHSGWLAGGGVGYFIERNMEVRFEVLARKRGDALFFNLSWYPQRGY